MLWSPRDCRVWECDDPLAPHNLRDNIDVDLVQMAGVLKTGPYNISEFPRKRG